MKRLQRGRVKARTRLQYEAAECGAACLGTILAYFGRIVDLPELRVACGVSRDGSNARQLLRAAREYGLSTRAYSCTGELLRQKGRFPCVVFWGFNHFLVVEGFDQRHAYLSDPAQGRVRVEMEEFLDHFTGIVMEFEPGEQFRIGGRERSPLLSLPATLRPYGESLLQLFLVATGQALLTLLVAGLTASYIDDFLQNQRFSFGIPILWLLLITIVGWLILLSVQYVVLRRMQLLLSKRLTVDLFRKLFQLSFSFFQSRCPGEVASRLLLGMETTQVVVSRLLRFLVDLWVGMLVLLVGLAISPLLALLVLLVITINLLLVGWLAEHRHDANRRLALEQGKVQGKGLQGINNIEALKASGLEFDFLGQWQCSFGNLVAQNQLLGSQMSIASIIASGSVFLLNAFIIAVGGLLIISGRMSLGSLVAFQFVVGQLMAPLMGLPQLNAMLQMLIGSLGRLDDLRTSEVDPLVRSFATCREHTDALSEAVRASRLRGRIELQQLSYRFATSAPVFLQPLDLIIPAGSHLAIVGSSGSGKTTLIRLLAGLYAPSGGRLLFDGLPWEHHGDRVMRDSLAYVPQQVFIFNATIEENLTLWRPGYGRMELESAASDADVLSTITAHPDAFSRHLRDNGRDLSGGEQQRLELARALLRKPSILLLDEATSALDNASQSRVFDSLRSRQVTIISVAHRLESALRSDQVLVMHNGQVLEAGSPGELLARGGGFHALMQAEQVGVS